MTLHKTCNYQGLNSKGHVRLKGAPKPASNGGRAESHVRDPEEAAAPESRGGAGEVGGRLEVQGGPG